MLDISEGKLIVRNSHFKNHIGEFITAMSANVELFNSNIEDSLQVTDVIGMTNSILTINHCQFKTTQHR